MHNFDTNIVKYIRSTGYKYHRLSFRFYLEIETTAQNNDTAIVIMKNPAKACINHLCINRNLNSKTAPVESDATVNHVIQKLGMQYKKIFIVNLYPFMHSHTKAVRRFLDCTRKPIMHIRSITSRKNKIMIIQVLKSNRNAKIFCAWGQESNLCASKYAARIYEFVAYCFRYHIQLGEFTSNGNNPWKPLSTFFPTHGSMW